MRTAVIGCVFLLSFSGTVDTADRVDSEVRPITEADRILAIYVEDWGLFSSGPPQVILAIWGDGHVVWSADRLNGGPPFRSAQIETARVQAMFMKLEKSGLFSDAELSRTHFGPDSKFTTMLLKWGDRRLKMRSWHEVFEDGGTVVATDHGLEPLNGRKRFQVLKNEPSDYLYYRLVRSEIRERAFRLVPDESTPIDAKVHMRAGIISWQPMPPKHDRGNKKRNDGGVKSDANNE